MDMLREWCRKDRKRRSCEVNVSWTLSVDEVIQRWRAEGASGASQKGSTLLLIGLCFVPSLRKVNSNKSIAGLLEGSGCEHF